MALWAERPGRRGGHHDEHPHDGRPRDQYPGAHPFGCPAGELAALLDAAGPALRWLAGQSTQPDQEAVTLLLPSAGGRPLPSPELAGPATAAVEAARPGGTALEPWRVPCLRFEAGVAAQLLGELFDTSPWTAMVVAELPGGESAELHLGASLRWLIAVHDLAWHTVRRGRVLPGLDLAGPEPGGDPPRARWRPVPDQPWRDRSAALAAAGPPSARAERPAISSGQLIAEVLDELVDVEARAALELAPPLLPVGRRRDVAPGVAGSAEAEAARVRRSRTTRGWLTALTTSSGLVVGAEPVELADLGRRLARWHADTVDAGPLRVSFRLVEPLGPDPTDPQGWTSDDHWRLEFLLASTLEPAVTLEASALWADRAAATALERTVPAPDQVFLDELDRAVRCYPPLREAFRDPRPAQLRLDRAGALAFLTEGAPALTAAGFGVLLPSWWQRPARLGLRMTARVVSPGTVHTDSLIDRDAVVGFDWQAAIGGLRLSAEELERLAHATIPLVRVRGQWIVADQARIAAALAFLQREGSGSTDVGEVLRAAFDPEPPAGGLPVLGVEADGWLGDLIAGRIGGTGAGMAEVDLPDGFEFVFRAQLRPYQLRGLTWLATLARLGLGAVLADDMGLGKTVQTLALLVLEQSKPAPSQQSHRSGGENCTLLICPMSLVGNWQREAARFAPGLRVHVHHGPHRRDGDLLRAVRSMDLVITTYAIAQRDVELLRQVPWARLVVDEAQNVKNRGSMASRAIRALPARHRIALTGTPVENRLADLHAVLDVANPGLFGTAEAFKERYSVPIERHGNERAADELRRRTRPLLLRRLKTDPTIISDLPDKVEMTVLCNLTVEQAALYRAVVADLMNRLEPISSQGRGGIVRKGLVLASLSKLKQICNHPAQFLKDGSRIGGRSGKLDRLEETLAVAIDEGDRALCFTQFAGFGALLQPYLAARLGREVLFLHGGLARGERERLVARFQADGGPPVFLLSLKAGGAGLNLTAANQVIHLDRWWNPAVEEQATDRAFRIGQRRNVQVRKLVCVGTIEERIDEIIASKRRLADTAVGSGEGWLTELPVEALAELVDLSDDAVSEDPADA